MPIKQIVVGAWLDFKDGDKIISTGSDAAGKILVEREVPIEPFVPDPAVWRSTGTPNGAAPIQNRQNLDVHNPESGGWTRYVRRDED